MLESKIEAYQYLDDRLNREGRPAEDYFWVDDETDRVTYNNIFIVQDGVTQMHSDPYPNPSPATEAAQIVTETIKEILSANVEKGKQSLYSAFFYANKAVKQYNKNRGVTPETLDYVKRQYAATVGTYGFIHQGILHWAQIFDSGVMVLDNQGNLKLDETTDREALISYLAELEKQGVEHRSVEQHLHIRSQIVNNPNAKDSQGHPINLGIMTGEKHAIQFLNTGSLALEDGDIVLFYSDGFIPLLQNPNFMKMLIEGLDERDVARYINSLHYDGEDQSYKHEKTLIAVRYQGEPT